ncbi:MAG: hypothetical protein KF878_19980 [Planctomycetes bacterium]|nr:hypothetical protein [Planctomycetota bacterium]
MQHDGPERSPTPGGWIVTSSTVQGEEGVRWVSISFFPEPEPDLDEALASGPWPRDPSISSKTRRLRRP